MASTKTVKKKESRELTLEKGNEGFEISPRKKNEMLAVLYITCSILIFTGILIERSGYVRQIANNFVEANGVGPVFLAIFFLYCGWKRFSGQPVFAKSTQILAFPLMYFSFIGFISSVALQIDPESLHWGGIAGNYLYWFPMEILGKVSASIVLFSIFITSFMYVTDIYVSDIIRWTSKGGSFLFRRGLDSTARFSSWTVDKTWKGIQTIHKFLYTFISDLIVMVEKGYHAFAVMLWPSRYELLEESTGLENEKEEEISQKVEKKVENKENQIASSSERKSSEIPEDVYKRMPQRPVKESKPEKAPINTPVEEKVEKQAVVSPVIKEVSKEKDIEKEVSLPVRYEPPKKVVVNSSDYEDAEYEILYEEDDSDVVPPSSKSVEKHIEEPEEIQAASPEESVPDKVESPAPEIRSVQKASEPEPVEEETVYTDELPDMGLLSDPPNIQNVDSEDDLWERGGCLIQALDTYKVRAILDSFVQGPTITRFELKPEAGTKLNKIVGLTNEIAMALAARSVRIEAPIPGTSRVGIEIPNENPVAVYFKEIVSSIAGEDNKEMHPLSIAFGKSISGESVIGNLAKMPHLLVAGATGSGKSVCVNTIISSILFRARPDQVKFVMVDPKQVELAVYRGIPHLITDVVTNPEEAAAALQWGVAEMEKRYTLLSQFGVRHIDSFNRKLEEGTLEPIEDVEEFPEDTLPYVVIIVDELADLMMVAKKDVETSICRIAQKARAVGIHLVIATQRPSVDVITGLIKANLPSRIAFMVNSGIDSKTILNQTGAENLLGKGDMLYYPAGQQKPDRVQGAFVSDDEVSELVKTVKRLFGEAQYEDIVSAFLEPEEAIEDADEFYDDKYNLALEVAIKEQYVSTSMLQRHLGIGYNRAARIVDVMYARGICGSQESGKKRKVLINWEDLESCKI